MRGSERHPFLKLEFQRRLVVHYHVVGSNWIPHDRTDWTSFVCAIWSGDKRLSGQALGIKCTDRGNAGNHHQVKLSATLYEPFPATSRNEINPRKKSRTEFIHFHRLMFHGYSLHRPLCNPTSFVIIVHSANYAHPQLISVHTQFSRTTVPWNCPEEFFKVAPLQSALRTVHHRLDVRSHSHPPGDRRELFQRRTQKLPCYSGGSMKRTGE